MYVKKIYEIFYDSDNKGYYAQDFSNPKQPTSKLYKTMEKIKEAIDNKTITFR